MHPTRILIAPLDWGLGHATRCIPVIQTFLNLKAEVLIAASGPTAVLLKKEFPSVTILPIPGYNIRYSKHKGLFFVKIIAQLPKLWLAIRTESKWLERTINSEKISAVVADNRLGLSNKNIPCVFITHQLRIKTGNETIDNLLQSKYYKFIERFSACWVPDNGDNNNLAGELSHPKRLPAIPVDYIGILSRCEKLIVKKKYDFLLLISGPEPQRSIFEKLLFHIFKDETSVAMVRGLPGNTLDKSKQKNWVVHDHLPASELNQLIQESKTVITRAGYSTVMDLVRLEVPAILIPTPGQTEQEYLAKYLMEKNIFHSIDQSQLTLANIKRALPLTYDANIKSELQKKCDR